MQDSHNLPPLTREARCNWTIGGLLRDNALTTNLNQNVPNPFSIRNFSALQSSNPLVYQAMAGQPFFTSPTIRKSQLLRPFSQMNGLNQILTPIGETKAHSFLAVFQRHMSSGLGARRDRWARTTPS